MDTLIVGEKYHCDLLNGTTKPVVIVDATNEWNPRVRDCGGPYKHQEYYVTRPRILNKYDWDGRIWKLLRLAKSTFGEALRILRFGK